MPGGCPFGHSAEPSQPADTAPSPAADRARVASHPAGPHEPLPGAPPGMTYTDYLRLDAILTAQAPLSLAL